MMEIDSFLETVAEGLKSLSRGAQALAEKLEEVKRETAKSQAPPEKKPAPKKQASADSKTAPAKKSRKTSKPKVKKAKAAKRKPAGPAPKKGDKTAIETVGSFIKEAGKNVTIEDIRQETGFNDKKIHNILYKLKQKKQIESVEKGIYRAL